jgi:hypothetical protein
VDQDAVYVVFPANAFPPRNAGFKADGVGRFAVGPHHLVHIVIDEPEGGRIDKGRRIDAFFFKRPEQRLQLGPAGNPLEHDAVAFFIPPGGCSVFHSRFILLGQLLERFRCLRFAPGRNHDGHMVEQVEAAERGRGIPAV